MTWQSRASDAGRRRDLRDHAPGNGIWASRPTRSGIDSSGGAFGCQGDCKHHRGWRGRGDSRGMLNRHCCARQKATGWPETSSIQKAMDLIDGCLIAQPIGRTRRR
eukprot:3983765-Pyramimonas_sp.AAC.1